MQVKVKKSPYLVEEELKYSVFYNLQNVISKMIHNQNIVANGNKVWWLNIKWLHHGKKHPGIIFYKYNHSDTLKKTLWLG